ncbi:MAG: TonB family protein [Bacteroidales bacterium]|nr:TonB family protein [Bacteroidales bacterium]
MVPKKTSKADLENRKPLFFEIGLALVMLLVLMAFEWETTKSINMMQGSGIEVPIEIDLMPITSDESKLEPAPPARIPSPDKITIVPDNLEPRGDVNIFENIDTDGPTPQYMALPIEDEVPEAEIIVQVMPKFGEGGLEEFRTQYVMKNLKYPEDAQNNGVSGCVFVEFIVERDGSISNVKSLRKADDLLVQEALRVIKASPQWTPGRHNGKPARVKFALPINFVLSK